MNNSKPDAQPVLQVEFTCKGVSKTLQFEQAIVRIGRCTKQQPCPDICVCDDTVSRAQAEIRWQGRNYWVVDTDSLTGTRVDGERLVKGEQLPLTSGATLEFGSSKAVVRIERHREGSVFDVFLCHSNGDKPRVRLLARELRKSGLNPWLDEDGLAPSMSWMDNLSSALTAIGAAAVIWGPNSPGPWQKQEIQFLQKAKVEQGVRIVPVILEGTQRDPEWFFISLLQAIDFRKPNRDSLKELVEALRQF